MRSSSADSSPVTACTVVRRSKVWAPRPPASRPAYASATSRSSWRNRAISWPTNSSAASRTVPAILSPPGTSPRPVLASLSVTMTTLRVKKGPCAPLRLSNMLSCPATGTTSTEEIFGDMGVLPSVPGRSQPALDALGDAPRVVVAGSLGQEVGRHVLVGDRSLETVDGEGTDRRGPGVARRGERSTVDHRVPHLDPGRPAVEEDAAHLRLEERQEGARRVVVGLPGLDGDGELPLEATDRVGELAHVVP